MKHALDVRDSAMFLFSALRSVHGLPPEYPEWLSAAAMLYEVGDYVNRNGQASACLLHHFELRDSGLHAPSSGELSQPLRAIWESRDRQPAMLPSKRFPLRTSECVQKAIHSCCAWLVR
jgi:hypothetical protein